MRWVFPILILLAFLLSLTWVGVYVELGGETTISLRIGIFKLRLSPSRKRQSAKTETKKSQKKKKDEKKERQPFPKPTVGEIREALHTLAPPLGRALKRLWRGVRIAPFEVTAVLAGSLDPAGAATLYGQLSGALWALPPLPRGREIALSVDYGAEKTSVAGTVGVSLRVGTVIAAVWTVGWPAARFLIGYLRKKKQQAVSQAAAGKEGL